MLTPQTHEATMNEEAQVQNGPAPPPPPAAGVVGGVPGGVAGGQIGGGIGGPQHRAAYDKLMNRPSAGLTLYEQEGMSSKENRILQNSQLEALEVAAESQDLGDYFEYNLKKSV